MKHTGHEGLVWHSVLDRNGLQLLKILGGNPDVDSAILGQGVPGVLPVSRHGAFAILHREPIASFEGIKDFLFFLI